MLQRAFDWLFRDRETDQIVLGQFPNPSLFIAMGLFAARWLASMAGASDGLVQGLDWAFAVAILWWAGRELFQGVNPFRRILGLVVIVMVIAGRVL
jgi:hypothetical protein